MQNKKIQVKQISDENSGDEGDEDFNPTLAAMEQKLNQKFLKLFII